MVTAYTKEMQGPRHAWGPSQGPPHVVCIQVRCCFSVLRSQTAPSTQQSSHQPWSPHTRTLPHHVSYCGATPPVTWMGRSTWQSCGQQAYTCLQEGRSGCAAPARQPGRQMQDSPTAYTHPAASYPHAEGHSCSLQQPAAQHCHLQPQGAAPPAHTCSPPQPAHGTQSPRAQ
jgi:hypothetical protein